MTEHTSDLDHRIAEALHTADVVEFRVVEATTDGKPLVFEVAVSYAVDPGHAFYGQGPTPAAALDEAMAYLRADRPGGA